MTPLAEVPKLWHDAGMRTSTEGRVPARVWGAELVHPIPLLAVAVLVINDHYLKQSGLMPGWLTGKLSDVAGLFFFPLLLAALGAFLLQQRWPAVAGSRGLAAASVVLTGVVFSLLKTVPTLNAWASALLGSIVRDPSDLVALPALGFSYLWQRRRASALANPWARWLAVSAAALASMATSRSYLSREYPRWELRAPSARQVGCAQVDAWVPKSGKQGVGLMLSLHNPVEPSCDLRLVDARIQIGSVVSVGTQGQAIHLEGCRNQQVYVPFEFDNEALWNSGYRDGVLQLRFRGQGIATEELWHIPVEHVVPARVPHYERPDESEDAGPPPGCSSTLARPPLEIAE